MNNDLSVTVSVTGTNSTTGVNVPTPSVAVPNGVIAAGATGTVTFTIDLSNAGANGLTVSLTGSLISGDTGTGIYDNRGFADIAMQPRKTG